MKIRLIEEIGTRALLRVFDSSSECHGGDKKYHEALIYLGDSSKNADWGFAGNQDDYAVDKWPKVCACCGIPFTDKAYRQVHYHRRYNTASGVPEPGDCFYAPWYHDPEDKRLYCPWDNCNDPRGHLMVILPNGREWDTDSRASNCTMKDDKQHRCWVKHGDPPDLHVDKAGHTCQAGAGSIMSGDYHGFLHNGELVNC